MSMPLSMIVVQDEHVEVALPEIEDDAFEGRFVHLSVGDGDTCFGDEFTQFGCTFLDALHTVVNPEHLTLAQQFAANRFDRETFVEFTDVGEDRLAVGGRGLQQGEVADADEAHLERARDRGCAEGENVDVRAQFLHGFLVLDAESLFFVDDEKTKVLELDAFLQQSVRADDAIDLARGEAGKDLLRFGGCLEP